MTVEVHAAPAAAERITIMDLLGEYSGDESESDAPAPGVDRNLSTAKAACPPGTAPRTTPAAQAAAPSPAKLFNPFAADSGPNSPAPGVPAAAAVAKRPATQVTGSRLPPSQAGSKAPKTSPGQSARGSTGHSSRGSGVAMMVPPQLHGRSNVVTEDLEKLFTKRSPVDRTQASRSIHGVDGGRGSGGRSSSGT